MNDSATRADLRAALILGAGAGLRSFAVPAVLGARGGGPFPGPARFIAFGAALGELITDKQPDAGSRWALRGLGLRLGFSTSAAYELAGIDGAVSAGLATLMTARAGSVLRTRAAAAGDPRRALASAAMEDLLAYGLVIAATRGPVSGG